MLVQQWADCTKGSAGSLKNLQDIGRLRDGTSLRRGQASASAAANKQASQVKMYLVQSGRAKLRGLLLRRNKDAVDVDFCCPKLRDRLAPVLLTS